MQVTAQPDGATQSRRDRWVTIPAADACAQRDTLCSKGESKCAQSLLPSPSHLLLLRATPAAAQGQNSRWCADYGRGYYNCGFATYEQCRATIAGFNRGSCYPNPQYGGERRYR